MAEENVIEMEMFTVELQFEERMALSVLLTQSEGKASLLGIVRRFREGLSTNEEEARALGLFTTPDGRTGWNVEADKPVEFKIGPSLRKLIVALLRRADASEAMGLVLLPIYEKFIGEVEEGVDHD